MVFQIGNRKEENQTCEPSPASRPNPLLSLSRFSPLHLSLSFPGGPVPQRPACLTPRSSPAPGPLSPTSRSLSSPRQARSPSDQPDPPVSSFPFLRPQSSRMLLCFASATLARCPVDRPARAARSGDPPQDRLSPLIAHATRTPGAPHRFRIRPGVGCATPRVP